MHYTVVGVIDCVYAYHVLLLLAALWVIINDGLQSRHMKYRKIRSNEKEWSAFGQ